MLAETQAERDLDRKARERIEEQKKNALEDILKRYESERCTPRGSLWAAFNAVTEHADHQTKERQSRREETRLSRRFDSILTGEADELKQAAYSQALALMNN